MHEIRAVHYFTKEHPYRPEYWMTYGDVEREFGINRRTVGRYARKGCITIVKTKGRALISKIDVICWMDVILANRAKHRPDVVA